MANKTINKKPECSEQDCVDDASIADKLPPPSHWVEFEITEELYGIIVQLADPREPHEFLRELLCQHQDHIGRETSSSDSGSRQRNGSASRPK